MKIALITDTHAGVRNDNIKFVENAEKFFTNTFFPYLKKNKIKRVVHLGDLMDRRKYVNFRTINQWRRFFLEPLKNYQTDIIIGNHDTMYRNDHSVNALQELVQDKYTNITVHTDPIELTIDKTKILFLPWINDANRQKTLEIIDATKAQIAFGHLEIVGFEMYRGVPGHGGLDHSLFSRFDVVCSGHYHHKSDRGQIHYLGAAGQYTWSDFADDRGFHIFDTSTRKLEFVKNPYDMFKKIHYDDSGTKDPLKFRKKDFVDSIVKVIVKNKDNPYKFDTFINRLEDSGTIDVIVVDDHLNLDVDDPEKTIGEAQDTFSIFTQYVDDMQIEDVDKELLQASLVQIYQEAMETQ